MSDLVLDSSVLLAYVKGEAGGETLEDDIRGSLLCTVNLAEVISVLVREGTPFERACKVVELSHARVVDFDHALAEQTGALIASTKHAGLSLGDRACLALAARENLPALTADRSWQGVQVGVGMRFVR